MISTTHFNRLIAPIWRTQFGSKFNYLELKINYDIGWWRLFLNSTRWGLPRQEAYFNIFFDIDSRSMININKWIFKENWALDKAATWGGGAKPRRAKVAELVLLATYTLYNYTYYLKGWWGLYNSTAAPSRSVF